MKSERRGRRVKRERKESESKVNGERKGRNQRQNERAGGLKEARKEGGV
jgi:hypothetical protein